MCVCGGVLDDEKLWSGPTQENNEVTMGTFLLLMLAQSCIMVNYRCSMTVQGVRHDLASMHACVCVRAHPPGDGRYAYAEQTIS